MADAQAYVGGMYWKHDRGHEYLVKTSPDNKQQRRGPRSPETEAVFATYT